jgi:hypothetical protein
MLWRAPLAAAPSLPAPRLTRLYGVLYAGRRDAGQAATHMKRTLTTTILTILLDEPVTQQSVGSACTDALAEATVRATQERRQRQTVLSVGGVSVSTRDGQCVVLFVTMADEHQED